MANRVPKGFRLAGVHCGIKSDPAKEDLALIASDRPATAAGVYTKNVVVAAPVVLDRSRTPSERIRAVVINSGNANACTGPQGDRDARRMAELAAGACGARDSEALVLSTGIIGELLPMEHIAAGITAAARRLSDDDDALAAAARGIMTTDTAPKLAARSLHLAGKPVQVTGIAKGAAMIGPHMATMLGVVLTDAAISAAEAQTALAAATEESFNCISVEGHMSTNDSVLLLANGAAGGPPLEGAAAEEFRRSLRGVCTELARAIASDAEGAGHLIEINVSGCATAADARAIAKTVAESPLVKTAVAGGDPNWGRIVSAAGYAGVPFDPRGVELIINGTPLYARGAPLAFDAAVVSASIRESRDTDISLRFREGTAGVRFWTCDQTTEYVRLNSAYHT